MAFNPRQAQILELVRTQGVASVETLAQTFHVTLQTVRRDVTLLCEAGALSRYHGGVRVASSTIENVGYQHRQSLNAQAKQRIARSIAKDVPNDCSLLINIGTTTEAVARELINHKGLRVITNNIHVATILAANSDSEVIIAPGTVRGRDNGVTGESTVEFIRQFKVDIGIVGISGIDADGTLRDYDLREVLVARSIVSQSREVWLAADKSKFYREALVELGHLRQIQRLYTDEALAPDFAELVTTLKLACYYPSR